jgi:hypothetical protein
VVINTLEFSHAILFLTPNTRLRGKTLKLLTRAHHSIKMLSAPDGAGPWVSHVQQWRNVISEGPQFNIFEGPPSRSAKGTSRAPYMHKFSRGSRACSSRKFLNLDSLKCLFLDFGERFHRILMVRKRHCNISEAHGQCFCSIA